MKFTEIQQIKNFEYSVACTDMALSESKKILTSLGTYRPSVKTHDLFNLSQKTERHLEMHPLRVEPLDKEAEKLCILREDSVLEFHAKYGMHEKVKLPRKAYDIKFNKFQAELLSGGSQNVYRFNLEHGKFMKPYLTTLNSISSLCVNAVHGLIGICGERSIQFIDQRTSSVVSSSTFDDDFTSLSFAENGLNFSVGTDKGDVFLFDLRSKEKVGGFKHNSCIKKVRVKGRSTISADKSSLKIFREGCVQGDIHLEEPINTFEVCEGVVFVGCDASKIRTFYSTEFGDIPDWCKIVKTEE